MARTTTTAAGTRKASGAGRSSAGSRKASTRSIKRLRTLQVRVFGLLESCSTSTSVQRVIDYLRQQRSEITRGTYAVRFDHGVVHVNLTKSERVMLRNFYSAVLKEAPQWLRIAK